MGVLDVKIQPIAVDVVGRSVNQVREMFSDGGCDVAVLVNDQALLGGYIIQKGDQVEIMRYQPV